ncbi:hypothetical protein FHR88_001203 [Bradyrhizobium betae]|nr:hypothetical protein [Bradyrhizobium betae]
MARQGFDLLKLSLDTKNSQISFQADDPASTSRFYEFPATIAA